MSDLGLSIAASGIDAAQTAMDTIAQNLSNQNTPGYVRETADQVSVASGGLGIGGGVRVVSISQPADSLLQTSYQQTQGALSQSSALQQVLNQAQLSFPEPSTTGLAADLSAFWQSWDSVASNPSDTGARQQVINAAQNVVSDLQAASGQLTTTATDTTAQLQDVVGNANTLLGQVASLNQQIVEASTGSATTSTDSLIDQRNNLMGQLSKDVGAVGTLQPDGSLQVRVGGVDLVSGGWSDTISLSQNNGTVSLVAATSGVTLSTASGTSSGLLAAVNQYLPGYQSQLNQVANRLASLVNGQLTSGYTATGAAGVPLFVQTSPTVAGLSVNPAVAADPSLLAAASTNTVNPTNGVSSAANDGSNAQAIADLWNAANGPDAAYRGLVQNVGAQVSSVGNQVTAATAVANAASENLQAVDGVDPNAQMVSLITFQQSYQASAKVISTLDSAVQSLLASV